MALTADSVSVVADIRLDVFLGDACLLPHLADLGKAKFGVETEEEFASVDGQVVLSPVPRVLQVLVVQRSEGIP